MELTDYHDAIIQGLSDEFAGTVNTIAYYSLSQQNPIDTPAILLELESAVEGTDNADDLVPLQCRMTLHVLLGIQTANIELQIRIFANKVFNYVRKNQFGLSGVTLPDDLSFWPGEFKPGEHGYESWYVTWQQTIYQGDSVWECPGFVPEKIFIGRNPNISVDQGTYEQLKS